MFQMFLWYDKEPDDQNDVKIIAIRCSNCRKETGLSMDNMNTKYKNIVTVFVLNNFLHHVANGPDSDLRNQAHVAWA